VQGRPGWRDPAPAEVAAITTLVPSLAAAARTGTVPPGVTSRAEAIGMVVERWTVAGHDHLVLLERPDARRGAGAYLFAVGRAVADALPWVLLEAHHAYYDVGTGLIAAAAYFAPPPGPAPLAFFTNSLHRYTLPDGSRSRQASNPADACHNPGHLLALATQAAALALPEATVVQLHGFGTAEGDDDSPPPGTRAVVSGGRPDGPTPLSIEAATRLRAALGPGVVLYPTEVTSLGATTNVEMKALLDVPGARFLHIELAASVREALRADPSKADVFAAALFAAASAPPVPDAAVPRAGGER
jgi:hypothetical protein